MIQLIERLLKRMGMMREYSDDEVINASIEDKLRDNEKIVVRLKESVGRRISSNQHLRETIKIAKRRTDSFEVFERQISGRRDD
jgi:hypothetical protein